MQDVATGRRQVWTIGGGPKGTSTAAKGRKAASVVASMAFSKGETGIGVPAGSADSAEGRLSSVVWCRIGVPNTSV